jgi:hypothetical protein
MGISKRYEKFREAQLYHWMLYLVGKGEVRSREDFRAAVGKALNLGDHPVLRELGLAGRGDSGMLAERCLSELLERGWVEEKEGFRLTSSGRKHLRQQMHRARKKNAFLPPIR